MRFKKRVRKGIIKLINPFVKRLGYGLNTRVSKTELLHNFYSNLLKSGLNPEHIVDIGANHGTWTREALQFFPMAQYSLIEPQERLKDSIKDVLESNSKVKFYALGAGKENGTFRFTIVDQDDSCSFKYSEEEAQILGFEQLEVPVTTLNDFIKERNLPIPEIVKIDAEGLDLDVLIGASNLFGKTEVFLVEAAIVSKTFKNDLVAVVNYMDKMGYRVFEITDLNRPWQNKVLWLVELAFVKKNGKVDTFDFLKN